MSLNFKADPCFLICGLDCFYTGNAKNYGSCPLDKILYSGYLANPCLCFWTTNFIQWLAVHWISSVQWTTLSSILNNRALRTPKTGVNNCAEELFCWSTLTFSVHYDHSECLRDIAWYISYLYLNLIAAYYFEIEKNVNKIVFITFKCVWQQLYWVKT
jgi:hypothetical protein